MIKLTVSVSLVLLQLSLLSRTSVGVPVPPIGPDYPIINPQPEIPSAPLTGTVLNVATGMVCVPVALGAVQLGKNLVGHCLNKFRTKDTRADPESGSNPGSTSSAHDPNGNRHSETPDENAPLIRELGGWD
ncbi:hypothetical protein F5887DRAFT_920346 [Amanita rubescens]|nr:hypothetical protein F5887DRAFT_920346 [Amanita rubescens]